MLGILAERIQDNRFLALIKQMLQAEYLEHWVLGTTLSGAPQGGVLSPLLSNTYLDQLDKFVEKTRIPENTRGKVRTHNPAYHRLNGVTERERRRGDCTVVREVIKTRRLLPTKDPQDPGYRRLRYLRYADDHPFGFTGPKTEAEEIKRRRPQFLHDELKLELSQEKSLITHAHSQAARFFGYDISAYHGEAKLSGGRRLTGGSIKPGVPRAVIKAKIAQYFKHGKPTSRHGLVHQDDYTIIATYDA